MKLTLPHLNCRSRPKRMHACSKRPAPPQAFRPPIPNGFQATRARAPQCVSPASSPARGLSPDYPTVAGARPALAAPSHSDTIQDREHRLVPCRQGDNSLRRQRASAVWIRHLTPFPMRWTRTCIAALVVWRRNIRVRIVSRGAISFSLACFSCGSL